jgi:two-component system NarL family response regulator
MARPDPLKVLLVDRPKLFRRCLAACLSRRRRVSVVGEAEDAAAAVDAARQLQPDVVVVDTEIADSGPGLVADLYTAAPRATVVVLTLGSEESARQLLLAGARGYLRKDCEPEDVLTTIERVSAGELVLGPGATGLIFAQPADEYARTSPAQGLSAREIEVLALVAAGAPNREIARELYITENTVKGHVRTLLRKLALDNRVQLATYALQNVGREPLVRMGVKGRVNPPLESS